MAKKHLFVRGAVKAVFGISVIRKTGTGCVRGIVKVVFAMSVMPRKKELVTCAMLQKELVTCSVLQKELVTCAVQQKRTCSLRGMWVALARSGGILVCEVLRVGVRAAASNRKKCDPIVGAELVGAVCEFWCRIGEHGL